MKSVFAIVLFCFCFVGCEGGGSYTPSVDTNSFDYNYSKNRFKAEGFSDKDSATAASAVMRFNEAQKNRKR